jgi:hypothetical protein
LKKLGKIRKNRQNQAKIGNIGQIGGKSFEPVETCIRFGEMATGKTGLDRMP